MSWFENPPYYLTAYGIAVKHGYEGTEEEWIDELQNNAKRSSEAAAESAAAAEAARNMAAEWAVGENAGTPSATNNAAYYADQADGSRLEAYSAAATASSASRRAGDSAEDAEAWAVGKRDGTDVGSDDPAYHNSAKYYADHIADPVSGLVTGWLEEHVDPDTGYVIDDSLSVAGAAADAKTTGDAVSTAVDEQEEWTAVTLSVQTNGYYDTNGVFNSTTGRQYAVVSPASEGERYRLTTGLSSTIIPAILFFDNTTFKSYLKAGTGSWEYVQDYEFNVPSGANKIVVQCAVPPGTLQMRLKKYAGQTYDFRAYTKEEADNRFYLSADGDALEENVAEIATSINAVKRYGLKWEIGNNDDLGARCFDAAGKSATIGIGSTNGSSDFDAIYPWSEMKRCNIRKNANGAEIVTFEGEPGFALDGTNGDVFVRIPKFYYERYRLDGYEYRVISAVGTNAHPAFIEDGKELDEIFISAFEGKVVDNKLRSIGGVIPTSNLTPQEFLTAAQANGGNYSLYDSRCVDAVWVLMAIEYGKRNTNSILGYGLANFEQAVKYGRNLIQIAATGTNTVRTSKWTSAAKELIPVGANITVCKDAQTTILTQAKVTACIDGDDYTDWTFDGDPIDVDTDCFIGSAAFSTNWCEDVPNGALSWHTGRESWSTIKLSGANNQHAIRYRWIENVFGNLWHFLPDITFDALQMYVCKSMNDYEMHKKTGTYYPESALFTKQTSNGNKSDVTGENYWITDLDACAFTKGTDFGRTYTQSVTSEKSFGAYYYLYDGLMTIANGGGFDHYYRCNMLTQRAWIGATSKWFLYGARLMYKHIINRVARLP